MARRKTFFIKNLDVAIAMYSRLFFAITLQNLKKNYAKFTPT